MPLARCPECGRVADGTSCFACGYEWPAGAQPPAAAAPAQPAAPPPSPPPPIVDETDFSDVNEPEADPAPAAGSNPLAASPFAPAPVSAVFQAPEPTPPAPASAPASSGAYEGSPAPPLALDDFMDVDLDEPPPPPPVAAAPARSPGNPFATAAPRPTSDENPFSSLDGPLTPPASPPGPPPSAGRPAAAAGFDPFDGEELPSTPPPLPQDALDDDGMEAWEVPTEQLDDLEAGDESATSQIPASLARALAAKASEGDETLDLPMEGSGGAPLLVDDDPMADLDLLEDQPTVTTARTPASAQPLHERLWDMGKRLEKEGRAEDAALIFEAAMCIEVEG